MGSTILTIVAFVVVGFVIELLKPDLGRLVAALSRTFGPPNGRAILGITWVLAVAATCVGFAFDQLAPLARILLGVLTVPLALFATFVSNAAYRDATLERAGRLSMVVRVLAVTIALPMVALGGFMAWMGEELRSQGVGMLVFGMVFGFVGLRGKAGPFLGSSLDGSPSSDSDASAG